MVPFKEKRLHERFDHKADIIYCCGENTEFNNAKMFNSSQGGMYFNSKYEVHRGSLVSIKMSRFCSISYANVMRCEKISGGNDPRYGIGIKFL